MISKKSFPIVLLQLTVLMVSLPAAAMAAARDSEAPQRAMESITPCDAYGWCREISSARFAGRLTGHDGYTAAARWAAGMFARWGLEPGGDGGGFLQEFPSPCTVVDSASMTMFLPAGGEGEADTLRLEPGRDFLPQIFTGSGSARAGMVFAGWGISAPELGYDDYEGIDVEGRFVLCFRGVPDRKDTRYEVHDIHTKRMIEARKRGALGLFYIYDEPIANPNGEWLDGFMPAIISEKTAGRLLSGRGLTPDGLKDRLAAGGRPISFELDATVEYSVASRHFPDAKGYNVVGYVDGGSDAGGGVVVGAHFDHCGTHMGMTFPGADDNGSGSATVMEIAQAFSLCGRDPAPGVSDPAPGGNVSARSVFFVLFGGEEKGLQGSRWFASHLPAGLDSVSAMLNFDMTGEGDAAGCGYTDGLKDILERADEDTGTLAGSWRIEHVGVRSSDFAPFFLGGAECLSFYSNGPHLHYHQTGDTIYRINPDILADIARLGFRAAWMAASE